MDNSFFIQVLKTIIKILDLRKTTVFFYLNCSNWNKQMQCICK